jgi:hypothetical protein
MPLLPPVTTAVLPSSRFIEAYKPRGAGILSDVDN